MISRRKSLELIGGIGASMIIPSVIKAQSNQPNGWLAEFAHRWDHSVLYTNEVLAMMPDEGLLYRPTEEVMSFGKQLTHLAWGNAIYAGVIKDKDPINEPEELTRQSIQAYLNITSKGINDLAETIDESQLFTNNHGGKDREPWNGFSISDLLLIAYHHTTHHRAQAIVYLRLKGIPPPKYRF